MDNELFMGLGYNPLSAATPLPPSGMQAVARTAPISRHDDPVIVLKGLPSPYPTDGLRHRKMATQKASASSLNF